MYLNATLTLIQTLISIVALFYSYKLVIAEVGIEQLGLWALMVSIVSLSRISEFGLSGSLLKYVSGYIAVEKNREANQAIDTATLSIAVLVGLVMAIVYFPVEWLILFIVDDDQVYFDSGNILAYCFISSWLAAISGVTKIALEGGQRYDYSTSAYIISVLTFMVGIVVLIPKYKINGLAFAIILQHGVMLFLSRLFLRRCELVTHSAPVSLSFTVWKQILTYGIYFQFISILKVLLEPVTKAYLGKFGGLELVGYFDLANKFATQMRRILVAMNQVIIPKVSEIDAKGLLEIEPMYKRNFELVIFVSIYFFSVLLCVVPLLESLWFGERVIDFEIMSIMAIVAFFVNTLSIPAYMTNLGLGDMKQNINSHVLMALTNIVVGLALGMAVGGIGIVLAWALSLIVGAFPIVIPFHKKHKISVDTIVQAQDALAIAVCLVGCGTIWYIYNQLDLYDQFFLSLAFTLSLTSLLILVPMLFHPTRKVVYQRVNLVLGTLIKKLR